MPSSRAARMTAIPCSREMRSYVRHDPSASADTLIPDVPSSRCGSPLNVPSVRSLVAASSALGWRVEGTERWRAEKIVA